MLNKLKLFTLIICSFLIGIFVNYYIGPKNIISTSQDNKGLTDSSSLPSINKSKSLGFIGEQNFNNRKLTYLINDEGIYFYPFENSRPTGFSDIVLEKSKYPALFNQDLDLSVIRITEVTDNTNKKLLKISNEHPNHGGYLDSYSIQVDPITGEYKEITPEN